MACEDLRWNHCKPTVDRSKSNDVAERVVRKVKEGTSAVLLQFGLDGKWWADSLDCFCYLRSVQDLLSDWDFPHCALENHSVGQQFLLGSRIEDHPISTKYQARLQQSGKKILPSLLATLYMRTAAGKETHSLQTETSEIHIERLNATEVPLSSQGERFVFPCADGSVNLAG